MRTNVRIISFSGKKIRRFLLVFTVIFLLLSYFGVNFIYKNCGFLEHVNYDKVREASEYGLEVIENDLTFKEGKKDISIHIYEICTDSPKAVVMYLSGIQQPSVTSFYSHSKLLKENGYASILIDVRGHGKSSGDRIDFGVTEVSDVSKVVKYIKSKDEYKDVPIVVQGVSMGGAIAVESASLIPDIDGLISMASFASWSDVCVMNITNYGINKTLANCIRPFITANGLMTYGFDYYWHQPRVAIKELGNKPALFMHSYGDYTVPIESLYKLLENHRGANTHVWVRASKEHFVIQGNSIANPYDDYVYCNNVLEFLDKYFGGEDS